MVPLDSNPFGEPRAPTRRVRTFAATVTRSPKFWPTLLIWGMIVLAIVAIVTGNAGGSGGGG